jgi:hypothetical protein
MRLELLDQRLAQVAYDMYSREVAMLEERLRFLQKEQEKFVVVRDAEMPTPNASLVMTFVPVDPDKGSSGPGGRAFRRTQRTAG